MPIHVTIRATVECDTCGGQLEPTEGNEITWPGDVRHLAASAARLNGWHVTPDSRVTCKGCGADDREAAP
jgi:hypothetical protein